MQHLNGEFEGVTRTVLELHEGLDVETRRVARLKRDVARLKGKNKIFKRVVSMHHDMLFQLAEEHLASLSCESSPDSEPEP